MQKFKKFNRYLMKQQMVCKKKKKLGDDRIEGSIFDYLMQRIPKQI
jgi:hypothetical protein